MHYGGDLINKRPQLDVLKKPGRKKKKKTNLRQQTFVDTLITTNNRQLALKAAGYPKSSRPEDYQAVQDALADRRKQMEIKFMDDAEEMRQNMLDLARNSTSDAVKFQATKDILDRAGLNPVSKNQTESAKYVSIESRVSRDTLSRFTKELEHEEAGE